MLRLTVALGSSRKYWGPGVAVPISGTGDTVTNCTRRELPQRGSGDDRWQLKAVSAEG